MSRCGHQGPLPSSSPSHLLHLHILSGTVRPPDLLKSLRTDFRLRQLHHRHHRHLLSPQLHLIVLAQLIVRGGLRETGEVLVEAGAFGDRGEEAKLIG